ncbi:kinase-like domain-containing protein [Circinella umbellata]|nr:kinase-like domain-containing protein [Circinella umbellata]
MNGCNRYLHLFTPLACGGTLQTLIDKKIKYPASDNLSKEKIRFIFYQLLHGVHHLHRLYTNSAKKLYIHGDIKPENILVMNDTDRPYIVISDFGHALSIKIENKLNLNQKIYPQFFKNEGTLAYFSPERCDPHHEWTIGDHLYVDIWALGVTLYQLITLEHPFVPLNNDLEEGDESHLIIQNIQNIKLRFNQPCWKKEYDITRKYFIYIVNTSFFFTYQKYITNDNNNNLDINFIKSILTKTNRPSIPQLLFHSFMVKSKNDINLARMQRRWDDYSVDEAFYSNNNNKLQEIYNDDVDMNLISDETFEKIQTAFENNTAIKFTLPDNILRRSYYEHDYNSISEIIERPESKSVRPLEFLDGLTLDPDEQILLEKASIMKE